jgi:copper chaperone
VTEEVSKIPGVTGVQVDVAAGRVTVEADRPVPADAVAAAVHEAGYEVVPA